LFSILCRKEGGPPVPTREPEFGAKCPFGHHAHRAQVFNQILGEFVLDVSPSRVDGAYDHVIKLEKLNLKTSI